MRERPDADVVVDARGLQCPMPIVLANRQMLKLTTGQVMKVLATDKGALADFPAWADDTQNEILWTGVEEGVISFLIRRA